MNSRERFLAACKCQPVDRPPVWLMRQAGRYLPEYRELKSRYSFWEMVRTPSLSTEITLQPIRRFGMDAAILFSDILIVLDAMGINISFEEGGPSLCPLINGPNDLPRLKSVNAGLAFDYVAQAIKQLRSVLPETALIGFAGAPFTLAAYLLSRGPSKDVRAAKIIATRDFNFYKELASRITEIVADLLCLQIEAGVDAVQLFDTWSLHLSNDEYRELALPFTKSIIQKITKYQVPVIHYIRNANILLEAAAESGCQVLSIDSSINLNDARTRINSSIALQGNFAPELLQNSSTEIRRAVRESMAALSGTGYIVNVGQGLTPRTPIDGVAAMVEAVKERMES